MNACMQLATMLMLGIMPTPNIYSYIVTMTAATQIWSMPANNMRLRKRTRHGGLRRILRKFDERDHHIRYILYMTWNTNIYSYVSNVARICVPKNSLDHHWKYCFRFTLNISKIVWRKNNQEISLWKIELELVTRILIKCSCFSCLLILKSFHV